LSRPVGLGELMEVRWQWKTCKYLRACFILADLRIEKEEIGECV
jgi:hypothetical protein